MARAGTAKTNARRAAAYIGKGIIPGAGGGGVAQALALGDTIGFIGCSVDFDANWDGYHPAFLKRINHRLQASPYGYYGWPGTRADEWSIQMPGLLASNPNVVFIGDGAAAYTVGTEYTVQSQTDAVEALMQAAAAKPTTKLIVLTPTRIGDTTTSSPNGVARSNADNVWRLAQHGRVIGNALVHSINAPYDVRVGGPDANCTRDGIHDNTTGSMFNRAKKFVDSLASKLPSGRTLPAVGAVPAGNMTTNPLFAGSGALTATGAGAANVSGTIATGYSLFSGIASGVNVVAEATGSGQAFTLSGNQPATSDIYMTVTVPGLVRGKKYIAFANYEVSGADGVSAGSFIRNLSLLPGLGQGSDRKGPLLVGIGDMPKPQKPGTNPINPLTGLVDDVGEPWLITCPQVVSASGASSFRIYMTPLAGAVDLKIVWKSFVMLEFVETSAIPYYQAQRYLRPGTGVYNRFFSNAAGVLSVGGAFPSRNTTTTLLSLPATNANATWTFQPGDFSGGNLTFDGTVEVQKSGQSTWTQVVASLATANWLWNASGYGLAAGDLVRQTITATNTLGSATAVETLTIT